MENKFTLHHVVLYAKGWYQKSDDIWEDLKKILEFDNYTPFTKMDVYSIIVTAFQESNIYRITELKEVLNGIHPDNCWKYGYNCTKETYDMSTAVMYYILSSIRFIDNTQWIPKVPKYNKVTPRPKDIELKSVIDHFNIKKHEKTT